MAEYKLGEIEMRFADLIWSNEPVSSGELVKLAEKELKWKKMETPISRVGNTEYIPESIVSGTLLARIEVEHSKVENGSMNFDGGNLTLETVKSGAILPEQPALIHFYNVLFVLSADQLDIDPSTLHEVGEVEEAVPPRETQESNGQSNRNIVGATLYEIVAISFMFFLKFTGRKVVPLLERFYEIADVLKSA